ncbi:hypothetical protein OHV33_18075, partial [Acinetobacter baumannii]|nr:hypothetical protein [Acinetobacter baumannii]
MNILIDLTSRLTEIIRKLSISKNNSIHLNCDIKVVHEIESNLNFISALNSEIQEAGDKLPPHYYQNIFENISIYNAQITPFEEINESQIDPFTIEHMKATLDSDFSGDNTNSNLIELFNRVEFISNFFKDLNYLTYNMVLL